MGLELFSKYYSEFLTDIIRLQFGKCLSDEILQKNNKKTKTKQKTKYDKLKDWKTICSKSESI